MMDTIGAFSNSLLMRELQEMEDGERRMRVIFLDVDGVLNTAQTKERIPGLPYIGISPGRVKILRDLVDQSSLIDETVIVLSSSWRAGRDRFGNLIQGHYSYLRECLAEEGLSIFDETPLMDDGKNRGQEIREWLRSKKDLGITGIVVLDDEHGQEFKAAKVSRYWIQTSFWGSNGGLKPAHVREALKKMRMEIPKFFLE